MKSVSRIALLVVVAFASLFGVAPAQADFGERIVNYAVDVTITDRGQTLITETIDYDFGSSYRHGIFRSLPMWDDLPNDLRRTYDLAINSVLQDGNTVEVRENDEDPFLTLQIGSPDRTITGLHTYEIQYVINDALTVLTQKDIDSIAKPTDVTVGDVELYWDVIGSEWEVPIDNAIISINTNSVPLISVCYAEVECKVERGSEVTLFSLQNLPAYSPVTAVITQSRSAFVSVPPANVGPQPDSWFEQFSRTAIFGLLIGFGFLVPIVLAARRRSDTIKTVRVVDFVRFEAPQGLAAPEVAAAWKGSLDARGLTSAIVQLAADGVVRIDTKKKSLDVTIIDPARAKAPWAKSLLAILTRRGQTTHLSEYDSEFAADVSGLGEILVGNAVSSGLRNPSSNSSRMRYIIGMVVGFLLVVPLVAAVAVPTAFGFLFLIPLFVFIANAIGYRMTPKVETEKSAEFLSEVLGFEKLFTTDASIARREFANRSGLTAAAIFATLLPFAIIYEAEESWVSAFPDLTPADLQPYGYNVVGIAAMSSLAHNAESALSSAMTAPSSSGSGSGGGSAGGGGGGGGGGSW